MINSQLLLEDIERFLAQQGITFKLYERGEGKNHKPMYVLQSGSQWEVKKFAEIILPLVRVKSDDIKIVLEFSRSLKRYTYKFNQEEKDRIKRMNNEGLSVASIARVFGCTRTKILATGLEFKEWRRLDQTKRFIQN